METIKIMKHQQNSNYPNALIYQVDTIHGRISLIMKDKLMVDKASFIPFININNDVSILDVNKLLIDYGHSDKCQFYNYMIMEYLFNGYYES